MADCILMQLGSNLHWDQNLQDLQMYAIRYARLTLDQTCKTCNPSVPIRTRGADHQIAQLGVFLGLPALVFIYIY